MNNNWSLPKKDAWSTPFAETLLHYLEICEGDQILDIASGGGIPAFFWPSKWDRKVQYLL